MRTATPALRCIARSSYLAPSNILSSPGKPLETSGSISRFSIYHTYPHYPPTRFSHRSALSTPWLGSNDAARADNVALEEVQEEVQEDPSLANQLHWPFFSRGPDFHKSELYGKWQWLSEDQEKLGYEADVLARDTGYTRFVDWPKHENDIGLWSCILDYRARKDGAAGIAAVLEGLMNRHTLRDMEGGVAKRFWGKILTTAVEDANMLNDVWVYAEWMYHTHGVQWPNLYITTISFFLQRQLVYEAQVWHIRLTPDFGLDTAGFLKFIKQSITVPHKSTQFILRNLYISSAHRGLYDHLIPHLFSRGCLTLANKWRRLLLMRNDGPASEAAKAFVRFRAGYFPNEIIPKSELLAANLVRNDTIHLIKVNDLRDGTVRFNAVRVGRSQAKWVGIDGNNGLGYLVNNVHGQTFGIEEKSHDNTLGGRSQAKKVGMAGNNDLQYLINAVHGHTFGIEGKAYDDTLGARWFASSWVSIDSTINTVQMLGFNSIGPLSLQSIALREQSPDLILHRIEQLAACGISIAQSSYTRAVRYFAAAGEDTLLECLLQSDIHPDVFDDISTQRKILDSVAVTGNWKQHELIMAVRLAISQHVVATVSNDLLQICLRRDKRNAALNILGMNAGAVQVSEHSEHTSDAIAHHILDTLSPHTWGRQLQKPLSFFYAALLRRLMPMQFPLPSSALQTILFRLGRDGLLEELEELAMRFIQQYRDIQQSPQPRLVYFHKFDVPTVIQEGDNNNSESSSNFQLVPHDLELQHELHPVRQVLSTKLQISIMRWGFRRGYYVRAKMDKAHVVDLMEPKHFHFARGIRLLAMLRDKGLTVSRKLPVQVMLHIAELYWSGRLTALYGREMRKRGVRERRLRTQFVLREVYGICEEAWQNSPARENGEPPLMDMARLLKTVQAHGARWKVKRPGIFVRRAQILPDVSGTPTRWVEVKKGIKPTDRGSLTSRLERQARRTYLVRRKDYGFRMMLGHIPKSHSGRQKSHSRR